MQLWRARLQIALVLRDCTEIEKCSELVQMQIYYKSFSPTPTMARIRLQRIRHSHTLTREYSLAQLLIGHDTQIIHSTAMLAIKNQAIN
jgi:hypothetical protein